MNLAQPTRTVPLVLVEGGAHLLRQEPHLAWRPLRSAAAKVVGLRAATASQKQRRSTDHHGPGAAEPREGATRRQRHHRSAAAQAGAVGIGYVLEDRASSRRSLP